MLFYTTGAESAAIDKKTIEEIGIPQMVLMERAALALAEETARLGKKILAVCEGGNNGGDGVCCARILHEWGFQADVFYIGGLSKTSDAFRKQCEIAEKCGVKIINAGELHQLSTTMNKGDGSPLQKGGLLQGDSPEDAFSDVLSDLIRDYDVIIDAVFGVGLSRNVVGAQAEVINMINDAKAARQELTVIACDIPSGISSESGKVLGTAVKADLTVTFGFTKLGMLFGEGRECSGRIITRDIGFPAAAYTCSGNYGFDINDVKKLLPIRRADANKGSFGKLLLVAGNSEISGAAVIAGQAAFRAGAGLVKIFTDKANRDIIGAAVPEALLSCYDKKVIAGSDNVDVDENNNDVTVANVDGVSEIKGIIEDAVKWSTAVAIGPGLGTDESAVRLLEMVLDSAQDFDKPVVIDADAINIISVKRDILKKYIINTDDINRPYIDNNGVNHTNKTDSNESLENDVLTREARMIITPHMLEMARLIREDDEEVKAALGRIVDDRFEVAKSVSNEYNVISVLKDARTVVSDGSDSFYINTNGNSGMAKGGSGDSLTGIIGSLLAQGMKPVDVARVGVFIHGAAGDRAAEKCGRVGMTATDLNDCIVDILN
ncbi:MAG: NAD(P)H-hydrate dehydratase [Eubacterium sp.]|nr:NAD(P)H-hydrate dehydratase [Eubacterium sp.]